MHKHSFSVPSVPVSAPTSPATRLNRSDRLSAPPVTPQRFPRAPKHNLRTPVTPASSFSTPYTPLSIRSFASSNGSTLTTPGSATSLKRIPVVVSPQKGSNPSTQYTDRSLADIAENWRSRANENGIKVSSTDDSNFADDEESDQTLSDVNSSGFQAEDVLLPPFLSTHHRVRAQSNAVPLHAPLSPQVTRTPVRRTLMALNTPPQKPTNVSQLKLKGSFTDPAHTRRRPSFGQMSTELFDIDENSYSPYPQSFSTSTAQPVGLPFAFQDPFHAPTLSTIAESVQQHLPDPLMHSNATKASDTSCSVCGRSTGPLAILEPCLHPLCSACLTSALNIVGEKDMECAVCKRGVDNFHLQNTTSMSFSEKRMDMIPESYGAASPLQKRSKNEHHTLLPSAFEVTAFGSLMGPSNLFGQPRDSSTPIPGRQPAASSRPNENIVLRIDNVPWDITPPAICTWLKQPVERVHVLLDRRGKTMSHAFVELGNEEIAKAALRGAQNSVLGRGKRARGVTVTRSGQEELMRALFPSWKGSFDGSKPSLAGLSHEHVITTLNTGLITEGELSSLLHLIRSPESHFLKVPTLPFHSLVSVLSKFPADIDSRVFWSTALRDVLFNLTHAAVQVLLSRMRENTNAEEVQLVYDLLRAGAECQVFTTQQMNLLSDLADSCSLPLSFSNTSSPNTNTHSLHTPDSATSITHFRRSSTGHMQSDQVGSFRSESSNSGARATGPHGIKDVTVHDADPFSMIAREFGVEEQLVQALVQRLNGL